MAESFCERGAQIWLCDKGMQGDCSFLGYLFSFIYILNLLFKLKPFLQMLFGLAGDPECRDIFEEVDDSKCSFLLCFALQALASSSHRPSFPLFPLIFLQYVFTFEHDEDGNISLANLEDGKGRTRPTASSKNSKPTIFSARKQVSSLLRNIVYVTSTLGAIPEERYVFMKFEWAADCPEDYQPSGFCDANERDNAVGFFSTTPFSM